MASGSSCSLPRRSWAPQNLVQPSLPVNWPMERQPWEGVSRLGVQPNAAVSSPGLPFSGVTSECSDPAMAPLNDGEQLFLGLAQGGPQADLPTTREQKGVTCWLCQGIIQELLDMLGEQPDKALLPGPPGASSSHPAPGLRGAELGGAPPAPCPTVTLPPQDAIAKAVSRVCSKVKGVLRGLCKRIMRKSLQRVASDIMAGKEPRAICVDVRMCRARAGSPVSLWLRPGEKAQEPQPSLVVPPSFLNP
ncbi:hypothetical protein QTO34_006420, partial [Cnephaeus nilssonii]